MSAPEEPELENLDGADIDPPEMDDPVAPSEERPLDAVTADIQKLEERVKEYQGEVISASEGGNDELLSTVMLRLARVNSALGKHAAYAQYLARNADRAARRFRAEKTLAYAKDMAVNKAELKSELEAKEMFTVASQCQLVADQASDLSFRTDTFLKMAQSRLSLLRGDKARG